MEYPHNYMRPPPPPPPGPPPPTAADPYQRPPGHQQVPPWSGSQFQYHAQPPTQSPPPPYAATPPPQLYPAHYPPPPTHQLPPRPPPPQPHYPQSYAQPQEWGNSWSHHQSWEYTANTNAEDWAAKARAWAAAKSASENQHQQPQLAQAGRSEEPNHYYDHYSHTNTQFSDVHSHTSQAPNYPHYSVRMGASNGANVGQLQHGQSSFSARDGNVAGNSIAMFMQSENSSLSPFVHQQEVPSSYSSVPGTKEAGDRYENFNNSSSLPVASIPQHRVNPLPPAGVSQPAESMSDLSNQPLNFAPHFNRDLDPHVQSNCAHSHGGPSRGSDSVISPNYTWGPSSAAGTAYHQPLPPTIPSVPQVDKHIPLTSHASAHSAPAFPTGPGFQPPVPMVGGAFGIGTGVTPHPTALSANGYGVPALAERPKKAAVPNWLREEIIKNKAVVKNTAVDIPKEDTGDDDSFDRSYGKGDQADNKSIDSLKSTEDEDEDEDEVEAARTAAINQEIKRVLTEVLLKVTGELFDEIATKVLNEDDSSLLAGHHDESANKNIAPSTSASLTTKATAKVLIPAKTIVSDHEGSSEKSASGPAGNLLGLASYASDDENGEVQSPNLPNQSGRSTAQHSSSSKLLEGHSISENGDSHEQVNRRTKLEAYDSHKKSPVANTPKSNGSNKESNYNVNDKELATGDMRCSDGNTDSRRRLISDDSNTKHTGDKSHENDIYNKTGSLGKDHKDSESAEEKLDKKKDEENNRHDERRARSERMDSCDDSRGREKAKGRSGESIKESDSRKRSPPMASREKTSDTGRERNSYKDDNDEKRQPKSRDEKKERSRHKSESGRHKRRRSSSVGDRDRESKDKLANDSSNESSDDSRRKSHHSRRHRSPSPIRQRKRNVSRSSHSKHSKHRHSPYSSLENSRRRRSLSRSRSRSRSPVHHRH